MSELNPEMEQALKDF